MTGGTPWLDEEEQQAWRAIIEATSLVLDRLDEDLKNLHGWSLDDFEVLVHLSEAPDRRLRMAELADHMLHSRSRLTYRVDRLARAGLVERQACDTDRRGTFAALTESGWDWVQAMAPDHVVGVREYLVDPLDRDTFLTVGEAMSKVAALLRNGR
jgi:DNA-binding MarR family transcriptional regulator